MPTIRRFAALTTLLLSAAFHVQAISPALADRMALVIGNGMYQRAPALAAPANDAPEIAASLERLGFSVTTLSNANFDEMRRALLAFAHRAGGAEQAIVFYAGHGIEIGGRTG